MDLRIDDHRGVSPSCLCRLLRHRCTRLLGLEMRDHLLPEQTKGVENLLMLRRPDGAQQNHLLDAQRFVQFEKPDALRRRADAE
jgi:hypothetical protein